ncbi:MAG: MG2 domain-containing protein [Bacteroidales bacterium]|nr:MG2 domain-containing protein [Bacteroidales bacterium]MDD4213769.1 MG2 domain-containing protein [Bacteroidales bacterium]
MDKKKIILIGIITFLIAFTIYLISRASTQSIIKVNPAFKEYVAAFTSGIISTESSIKVRMNFDVADSSMFEKPTEEELFDFSPSIKGKSYWIDTRTVEFRPDSKLEADKLYTAKFYLSKVIHVPDSMRTFIFQFRTTKQAFEVKVDNHKAYSNSNLKWEKISGTIITADVASADDVAKLFDVTQGSKKLKVTVMTGSDKKTFTFVIDSVNRDTKASVVKIKWDGKPILADNKGSYDVEIPSINDFNLFSIVASQNPEPVVSLFFSDPLLEEQDLNGLITLGNINDLKFDIEDNQIKIYPPGEVGGTQVITVYQAVKNINSKELGEKYVDSVTFEDIKPNIRLVGNGTILPSTNGLIFPFEAVNVNAVDVKIFKIYENNISQFLQVNDLDGEREMSRVGKLILKKKIQLQSAGAPVLNYGNWSRYYIDLSELIQAEQGAIYQVTLGIKKAYSTYGNCTEVDEGETDENLNSSWDESVEDEPENWYYYDYYGYYYDYDDDYYYYDWYERDDPCEDSYFRNKVVSRNVLATDIGIIAKVGSTGELHIFTTDLVAGKPMPSVSITVLDYQSQELNKAQTNSDGAAVIQLKKVPYLIVAAKDNQRAYLKMTGGSALSLSMFEVGGEAVRKGIKGFIYTERGVWRPGDSIFLVFILEDKLHKLSPETPVVFDLTNPRGQKVQHIVKTKSVNGFYDFRTATDPNALTGYWTVGIRVGGSYFSKSLKIETIKPNRLKIKLDFGSDMITQSSNGTLEAKWLHGAVARNLKADVTVVLNKTNTVFKKYSSFIFDDPAKRFYSETYKVFSDKLNEEGKAEIIPDIAVSSSAPGVLRAGFETRVFEQGGEFSVDRFSLLYYPFETYVGIKTPEGERYSSMLNTEKNYSIEFVNVNTKGSPVKSGKVQVDIYKVNWRWWWDNSGYDVADFVRSQYNEPYKTFEQGFVSGKGQFNITIPDADWGRYFIRITDLVSGHSTGKIVYFDWADWASRSREGKEGAAMLMFSADKEKYQVGDEVKLTIPSSDGARALVTIETGSKVLQSHWLNTEKEQTTFKFTVTEEMAPNVYAAVTMIQPHGQTANDLPIRLYGVIPIIVEDPNTHLRPVITMNDVLRPEENASITIKEETGKAMTYTVAIVDEGLLDLTKFTTPEPWNYFYAKEALGIKTWDLYDYVMGAYGGQLERILSIGGGDDGGDGPSKRTNRFKPMVKFFGPFALKKGASNTYTFKMPQYIGSVRVMVIAGQDGAYGNAEKTVAVRKPLMLLGTLPRVVGPGETVSLPVSVFAMEKFVKNVNVKLTTNDMFTIEDNHVKSLTFKEIGDDLVTFKLKVKEASGIGKVKINASSGKETAVYEIEIDVRNPNPEITEVIADVIKSGKSWSADYIPVGIAGTNKGVIEVSSIPPINLEKRLKYLISYPYGCIEQTTSAAFPQLFLANLMELDDSKKKSIERNIKAAINRISSFQTPSGGFSYWPGYSEADQWSSCYAGHFLLEAKDLGYNVSPTILKRWEKYQKNIAKQWTPAFSKYYEYSDVVQAYRLYTLALAKVPDLGSMNLLKEQKNLSIQARWRLAAAYQLAGHSNIAKQMVANASTIIKPYKELSFSYGCDERDRAMIVEALSLLDMRSKAAPIVNIISSRLSKDQWMSTQTTAYCLLAISKYVGSAGMSPLDFTYTLNNGTAVNKKSAKPVATIELDMKKSTQKGKLKIKNNGKVMLYARLILTGIPAAGEEKAGESNLKIEVEYKSLNGEKIDVSKLEQGTDFMAEVSITNPGLMGYYYNMALSHIFPSGWEIHNTRMDESYGRVTMSSYDYQDFRDDRVYTFFSIKSNDKKIYKVLLNASYLGRFYMPTVSCAAMYDDAIYARTKGQWVEVVPYNDKATAEK